MLIMDGDVNVLRTDLEGGMAEGCKIMDVKDHVHEDPKKVEKSVAGILVSSESNENLEPYEGLEFETEEAARMFYDSYARRVGFRIRISKYSRSRRDNSIISRRIVCSKEGFREYRARKGILGDGRKRQCAVTRVGCKAMVMVKKVKNGRWVVAKFVKEHNHGPVPPKIVDSKPVIQNGDEIIEKPIIRKVGNCQEPFEGMEFDSENAAMSFYSAYAKHKGFRARISKYCRSRRDNSIISRRIVCSKEGFREIRMNRDVDCEGKAKRSRVITRIGCKAMIIIKKQNSGKWVVSRVEKEHNHSLVSSEMVPCLQLHTEVSRSMHDTLQGFELVPVPQVSVVDDHKVELHSTYRESLTLYNQLYHEIIKYVREGAETIDTYNVAMSALQEAIKKVTTAKRTRTGNTHNEDAGMKTCQGTELVLVPDGHASHTHSSVRKRKFQKADKDTGNIASIQKSKVLDSVRISHANSNLCNSTGNTGPLDAETQLVEISHVPVTLCIPVARSLKAASPAPVHPISSSLIEALPLSAHPHTSSRTAATKIPPQKKLRAGNPLVHAAAIAAGARVVPPTAAAELIRAVEARVRYARSVLGGSGPLVAVPLAVWSGDQCVASPEFREVEFSGGRDRGAAGELVDRR